MESATPLAVVDGDGGSEVHWPLGPNLLFAGLGWVKPATRVSCSTCERGDQKSFGLRLSRHCVLCFHADKMAPPKDEQKKLQLLLKEAVVLLCKSSVTYSRDIKVEGLLGVTVDSEDVFLVNINELLRDEHLNCSKTSHDSESGEKVSDRKVCENCHNKEGSTESESSRKRSLEISDNSSQCSEANKTDVGPPPLPARRKTKAVEPPLKRRNGGNDSSASNTSVTTVIVKSSSFVENDPTYQTLEPDSTDPTNNHTQDIFETPSASRVGTPLASSTAAWENATTSTQVISALGYSSTAF